MDQVRSVVACMRQLHKDMSAASTTNTKLCDQVDSLIKMFGMNTMQIEKH
jgi:hypothetical protein